MIVEVGAEVRLRAAGTPAGHAAGGLPGARAGEQGVAHALPGAPRRERTSMTAAAISTAATTTSIHWLDTPSR
jgi:hypothetical protein